MHNWLAEFAEERLMLGIRAHPLQVEEQAEGVLVAEIVKSDFSDA